MNIEAMAREAGDDWDHTRRDDKEFLAKFATIVRAKALREAAEICKKTPDVDLLCPITWGESCAAAILAAIDVAQPLTA